MKKRILIAYYTHSGKTKKTAEIIRSAIRGDLFPIEPAIPYPTDFREVVEQSKKEIKENFHPTLKALPDFSMYDVIVLGTPIWCSTMAPPAASFLCALNNGGEGKIIVPFATHGGGGLSQFPEDVQKLSPNAEIGIPLEISGRTERNAEKTIDIWLIANDLTGGV